MAKRPERKSKFVVYAALAGNLTIAAVKFTAAAYTGSAAMLSEAVHSLVDTGNQGLLLVGLRQAARRPTAGHPFGHGLQLYFWSFVVAILIFGLGAGVSILEGIDKIRSPHPIRDVWMNYAVLGASALIEGTTLLISLHEFRRSKGRRGWFEALRHSKDPSVFTVVLEDSAALSGLGFAFLGLLLAEMLHAPAFDGIASILIGLLLASAAWFLAAEAYGLLTGEAAAPEVCDSIRELVPQTGVRHVNDLLSMHFGPDEVLLVLSIEFEDHLSAAGIQDAVNGIERRIQAVHPEMTRIFIEAQRSDAHHAALHAMIASQAS